MFLKKPGFIHLQNDCENCSGFYYLSILLITTSFDQNDYTPVDINKYRVNIYDNGCLKAARSVTTGCKYTSSNSID